MTAFLVSATLLHNPVSLSQQFSLRIILLFLNMYSLEQSKRDKSKLYAILTLVLLLIAILTIVVILYQRLKLKRKQNKRTSREIHLRELARSLNNDQMEVDQRCIRLYGVLGEGAFGVVRKGLLLPNNQDVAVKMLKGLFY